MMIDRTGHLVTMRWLTVCAVMALAGAAAADKPAERIMPADFVYRGAFRLPDGATEYGWPWSGQGLTYYPAGDPKGAEDGYAGSLFGIGHNHRQQVSEISIPKPVISKAKSLKDLPVAKTLQKFADVRGKMFPEMEQPRAGLAFLPAPGKPAAGRLHFCFGPHMHENERVPSHGSCSLDLSKPVAAGPWQIGNEITYLTTDYMIALPPAWAKAHVGGMRLATGRFRDGGQGSMGPTLIAFEPTPGGKTPPAKAKLPAKALLKYSAVTDDPPHRALKNYHHADEWSGAAWLTSGKRSALAIVGSKGKGKCWYGFANGVVWPEEGPWPPVPAAPNDQRGWWSASYSGQALLYDVRHLAAVAAGKKKPHEPQPYAALEMDERLYTLKTRRAQQYLGAAAFDAKTGRLFVMEVLVDEDKPIIHVWQIRPAKKAASARTDEKTGPTKNGPVTAAGAHERPGGPTDSSRGRRGSPLPTSRYSLTCCIGTGPG